jgi:hypothetical protein
VDADMDKFVWFLVTADTTRLFTCNVF